MVVFVLHLYLLLLLASPPLPLHLLLLLLCHRDRFHRVLKSYLGVLLSSPLFVDLYMSARWPRHDSIDSEQVQRAASSQKSAKFPREQCTTTVGRGAVHMSVDTSGML